MPRPSHSPTSRAVLRQSLSVSLATGLYGISFGALAVTAGLSVWQTMVVSMLMFSGASQFAVIGVIAAGGSAVAASASAALLGVRNGLYAVQNRTTLRTHGPLRFLAAHLTIDESTAVAAAQQSADDARAGFWWTGGGVWVLWNAMTLVGALAGDAMGDPKVWRLDAAASAAFLGLLWPRMEGKQTQVAAGLAAAAAVGLVPVAPPGVPVLGAACVVVIVGLVGWARPGVGAREA